MKKSLTLISIFIATLFLDIYTKKIANKNLTLNKNYNIYKNLNLRLTKNKGAMLNSFSNHRTFLLLTNLFIFILLSFFIKNAYIEDNLINLIGATLIFSGGVGNNIERLKNKEVTDFLYINFKKLPIFNVADVLILTGIIVLFLNEI
ncbi:MAG: signal peptidase II [Lachnospirales bacterium]